MEGSIEEKIDSSSTETTVSVATGTSSSANSASSASSTNNTGWGWKQTATPQRQGQSQGRHQRWYDAVKKRSSSMGGLDVDNVKKVQQADNVTGKMKTYYMVKNPEDWFLPKSAFKVNSQEYEKRRRTGIGIEDVRKTTGREDDDDDDDDDDEEEEEDEEEMSSTNDDAMMTEETTTKKKELSIKEMWELARIEYLTKEMNSMDIDSDNNKNNKKKKNDHDDGDNEETKLDSDNKGESKNKSKNKSKRDTNTTIDTKDDDENKNPLKGVPYFPTSMAGTAKSALLSLYGKVDDIDGRKTTTKKMMMMKSNNNVKKEDGSNRTSDDIDIDYDEYGLSAGGGSVQINKDESFFVWDDNNLSHIRKYTCVFVCPVTYEIFPAGRHGDPKKYEVRDAELEEDDDDDDDNDDNDHDEGEVKQDKNNIKTTTRATTTATAATPTLIKKQPPREATSKPTLVWFSKKTLAEHGAASVRLDCHCYRSWYATDPTNAKPVCHWGYDEPYLFSNGQEERRQGQKQGRQGGIASDDDDDENKQEEEEEEVEMKQQDDDDIDANNNNSNNQQTTTTTRARKITFDIQSIPTNIRNIIDVQIIQWENEKRKRLQQRQLRVEQFKERMIYEKELDDQRQLYRQQRITDGSTAITITTTTTTTNGEEGEEK